MSTEEEQIRRDKLIEQRCRQIEAGKIKSCDPAVNIRLPAPDICPSCERKMRWFANRKAFLCTFCVVQPTNTTVTT